MDETARSARIHISGIVQGVGFRPFIYALATRLALNGWVRNTSAGVDIEVDGPPGPLAAFIEAIWEEAPPLAHIDDVQVDYQDSQGFSSFEIIHSQGIPGAFQPIPPDVSICPDCLAELFNPADRRYRYPFINCTNCGPRFTIIRDIPYDRPQTTMADFPLCPECAAEYHNPRNRRFHAQPVACPRCGPQVWLELSGARLGQEICRGEAAIQAARRLLAEGQILAIRGLGGFHLACDATNPVAVAELRRRKLRVDKAFAVMLPNLKLVEANCHLGAASRKLLESVERPIVILDRRSGSEIAAEVAPGQDTLGVMLPYTPLHYLMLEPDPGFPTALVMTSGNLSEEPIVTTNAEARQQLGELADAFLFHNREIHTRCDDSVVQVFQGAPYFIRRSRGYAPFPIHLEWQVAPILATGAELKNTFCLAQDNYAFLSHHIGDLQNYETLQAFETGIRHFERLFRIHPRFIAYDLHPDYMATRYALQRAEAEGLPALGVQHHHAHIAACMAEHRVPAEAQVIGVSFDGTGFGDDGAIWGGEVLLASYTGYQRCFHLDYIPLPGGDLAVREPWRLALAWLERAGIAWSEDLPPVAYARSTQAGLTGMQVVHRQLETGLNSPPTSSMGRLFDAVASLAGVRQVVNYEAQAAIELEALAHGGEYGVYPFEVRPGNGAGLIDPLPMIHAIVDDLRQRQPVSCIAARFHNTLVMLVDRLCHQLRQQSGLSQVVLSGGVWQNRTLLQRVAAMLKNDNFDVLIHQRIPANDGGLAVGQVAIAAHRFNAFINEST